MRAISCLIRSRGARRRQSPPSDSVGSGSVWTYGTARLTVVRKRLEDNAGQLQNRSSTNPQIHYVTAPPERTDEAEAAVPFLQVTERYKEPAGPKMSRQEMFEHLIRQYGQRCQGCDRAFDDPRYLQLDHNTPRADGGINHITNRVLLCGPCNMLKSNIYTLSGLRGRTGSAGIWRGGSMRLEMKQQTQRRLFAEHLCSWSYR